MTRPSTSIGALDGAGVVTLSAGDLEASFIPADGLLGTSLRYRGEEFLSLEGGLARYRGRGWTGLPILAPWANRLARRRFRVGRVPVDLTGLDLPTDEHGFPIHGLDPRPWEVERIETSRGAATLLARCGYGTPEVLVAFPFPHELRMRVVLRDATMTIVTSLRPTGRRAVPVVFGFHPYFRLPEGRRSSWTLRLPARRHLRLERGIPTGEAAPQAAEALPIGRRTFDDLFGLGPDRTLWIAGRRHRLSVRFGAGYPWAQVFAPRGKDFVCLEPMTAPTNALLDGGYRLARPGEAVQARFGIGIEARTG